MQQSVEVQPVEVTSPTQPVSSEPPSVSEPSPVASVCSQSEVASMVRGFEDSFNNYCNDLDVLNKQVRQHTTDASSSNVQSFVAQFDELANRYLGQREEHLQSLRESSPSANSPWTTPYLAAVEEHTVAIGSTRESLAGASQLVDAAAACRQFLLATRNLTEANQSFQAELHRTLEQVQTVTTPTNDVSAPTASAKLSTESRTESKEFVSVDNLERAVAEFIEFQAFGPQKFSVALVEIDQLATMNAQHGQTVSNRVLEAIEQTFVSLSPRSTLAKDPQRQQLLYFQLDISARDATRGVEQVRQRTAAANFQHNGVRQLVTVSCGVAEATGEQTPQDIVARLMTMLREAQRYGRNCTFFQEGKQSAPAIPPTISVEDRVIEV